MVGAICGIGGGIIIKPVLDSFGILDVDAISFLSGCTVLSMTLYAVGNSKMTKTSSINYRVSTALAIGAVFGGIAGKAIFQSICNMNKITVGLIQAICLIAITAAALMFTVRMKKIQTIKIKNIYATAVLGLALGLISSFLGIGGGPLNLAVLFYFFSMEIKVAAENSLYIILFSQSANLMSSVISDTVPRVDVILLILMICGGVAGGVIGKIFNKKMKSDTINNLFILLMITIIIINVYNVLGLSL